MYTKGTIIINNDAEKTLHVSRALIDTGAHGGNYIGRKFLTANKDFLRSLIKSSDSSVFLADGITELKIDETLDFTLLITAPSNRAVSISATFSVIDANCDLIIGLNDLVLQSGDYLVEMVQRAVAYAKEEKRAVADASLPMMAAQAALQSVVPPFPPARSFRHWTPTSFARAPGRKNDGREEKAGEPTHWLIRVQASPSRAVRRQSSHFRWCHPSQAKTFDAHGLS